MHKLLKRQLLRHLGADSVEAAPPAWQQLVGAVDQAYQQADEDRQLLDRSLELTSLELQERYNTLLREIDQRKQAEEALRRAHDELEARVQERTAELARANKQLQELLAFKDELVAKVSHELRTPLTSIKEGLSLMLDRALGSVSAEQEDFLRIVDRDVDRLTELITNLLDISRIEAGRMPLRRGRVDVRELLEATIQSHRPLTGNRAVTVESAGVPAIFVDADGLIQVFGNLLSNAIKFTADSGTIAFRTRERDGYVAVSIEDNGPGISADDVKKLFQKFSQVGARDPNHPRGTGLGLVLCKELVELHNGRIEVASEMGRGTIFTVLLPIYAPNAALTESFQELQRLALSEGRRAMGVIAVKMGEADLGAGEKSTGALKHWADEIRRLVHRSDVVLEMDPPWMVVLCVTDAEGVQAIVRRLRGSLPSSRKSLGTAVCPGDGTDPLQLFEFARRAANS